MSDTVNAQTLLIQAFHAAKACDYKTLCNVFSENPMDVNATISKEYWKEVADKDLIEGRTLLMVLSKFEPPEALLPMYTDVLGHFKLHHADPNQRSNSGAVASMFATHNGNLVASNFFAGWEDVDWTARTGENNDGMSAYDFAADGLHAEVMHILESKVPQAVTIETARVVLDKKLQDPQSIVKKLADGDVIERLIEKFDLNSKNYNLLNLCCHATA